MSLLRIGPEPWSALQAHFAAADGERFGFLLARGFDRPDGPLFLAESFRPVADAQVDEVDGAYAVRLEALLPVFNEARRSGLCVIEAHTHPFGPPGFSRTDRQGLREITAYAFRTLPGRPYGALVWADDALGGEWFSPDGATGSIERIGVAAERLLDATPTPPTLLHRNSNVHARQVLWLGEAVQDQIRRMRVAVVGCGGTGSLVVQQLTYLGFDDLVLIDDDIVDDTNLNRLVTATPADIGRLKVDVARELVLRQTPTAAVGAIDHDLRSLEALDRLKTVDLIFGCVDNDGARLVLNELAVAYRVPYVDIGTGIHPAQAGSPPVVGGRVAIVRPGSACLSCLGQIDVDEARYFLSSRAEQKRARALGYVSGVDLPAPAVISLNSLAVSVAIQELLIWLAGTRPPYPLSDIDGLGQMKPLPGPWVTPRRQPLQQNSCVVCARSGEGDSVRIERYVPPADPAPAGTPKIQGLGR